MRRRKSRIPLSCPEGCREPSLGMLGTHLRNAIWKFSFKAEVPSLFGTRDRLCGRQFSIDQDGRGDGFRMIRSALHLLCILFLSLLHQLHLRSSGIRSWRLGTPGLRDKTLDFHFYFFSCYHNPPPNHGTF